MTLAHYNRKAARNALPSPRCPIRTLRHCHGIRTVIRLCKQQRLAVVDRCPAILAWNRERYAIHVTRPVKYHGTCLRPRSLHSEPDVQQRRISRNDSSLMTKKYSSHLGKLQIGPGEIRTTIMQVANVNP